MYTIGDVSKIVNVSANTLRYYDEIGLLKPCIVQSNNQYRYYSDTQIKEIIFILELKQYGFSLDEIRILLQDKSNQKLKLMLEEKRVELYNDIARLRERYIFLENRIFKIAEEDELKMKSGKILIVDDFALARKMIRNIIEEYGYTVVGEVSNGKDAIVAYDALKPELVIMDITMPKMDGIDAATKIMQKYKNARIIMCSAMSQAPLVLESIKAGAQDFVSKPISSLRLIHAVVRSFDENQIFKVERINHIIDMIEKKRNWTSRLLNQEEIDLLILKIINESEPDEAINNFLNKIEFNSLNEHEYSISSPSTVDKKAITFLKEKFVEISKGFSYYLSGRLNNECTMKLISVENITISEFKTLLNPTYNTGTIKINICCLPIYINVFGDKKEMVVELLDFTAKNLKVILPNLNTTDVIIDMGDYKALNENNSIVLISFSIEFTIGDKGFLMLSLPHNLLKYLLV